MKLLLALGTVLCVGIGGDPSLAAQIISAPSQSAPNHTGLDGSAYASIQGGYTGEMGTSIQKRWFADPRLKQLAASGTTEIERKVKRDGRLASIKVTRSSGDKELDAVAVAAAKAEPPVKDLPREFKGARFRLLFLYNLPSTPDRPACNSLKPSTQKKAGGSIKAPKVLYEADAEFSEAARKLKYQGALTLGLTVTPDGTPAEVCLERGLGNGLDENAVAAVRKYRFQPATEDDKPVSVRISVEIAFRLY
jgi:TonB family protein